MVDFGGAGVDVGVEVESDGVVGFLALGVAAEGEGGGLEVELDFGGGHVGGGNGEEDVVFGGFAGGGALCPGYYRNACE